MPTPRKPDSPPTDLDAESKKLWKLTITQLEHAGTWDLAYIPALERYIRALERSRLARKERGGQLTETGSQGQMVQHPNLKTEREAERDAREYANDLLLTAAARKRHQIEPGDGDDDPLEGRL